MAKWILLWALLLSGGAMAQERGDHPIDNQLDACMEKNTTTAGMVECIGAAHEAWDSELNQAYQELMRLLDAEGKAALKAAQVAWLAFRDREYKLIDNIYSKAVGTMYIPMHADERMMIVKKRALELRGHVDLIKQHR